MMFSLLHDFAEALTAMPPAHPRRRILALLDEAIRRDVHFIDRHPTTLFQCLWNSCWWYDCPEAAKHYVEPQDGWDAADAPWMRSGPKLATVLEAGRGTKERCTPGVRWLRTLHPLPIPLGT